MKKFLPLILLLGSFTALQATHIVGGFISYRFISGTTYEVTLTIYRDCNSATPFDGTPGATTDAIVGIFANGSSTPFTTLNLTNPVITTINPPINNPCLQTNSNVCVEQGVYTATVTLPSGNVGYTFVHERCCRNGSIDNVALPGDAGAAYVAYVPPTNPNQNSSPVFNDLPPLFICVNAPLVFDYSATDVDGDVLRYSLCTPYDGGTAQNPAPNPPAAPPYGTIQWNSGYSNANLLGGAPPLRIDSVTGVLTGTPNTQGQFVIGVCVSEYRNGVLIGTYLRDYQLNVTQCNIPIANIPSTDINPNTGIGTYIVNCGDGIVNFQNNTYNPPPQNIALSYQWNFGDPTTTGDTSTQFQPSYTYHDTGVYTVQLIVVKGSGGTTCTDTTYALVKVYDPGTADFNAQTVCPHVPNQFTDLSTTNYGTIDSWLWSFGDGFGDNIQNPTHVYDSSGFYQATLISTNSFGCSDTVTKTVTINTSASSNFGYTPPCVNTPVTFSLGNNTNVTSYNWTLSDGSTSTQPTVSYTYTTGGTFPVTLITSTLIGCRDTTTRLITVQMPVTAVADSEANACAGYPVQLNASGGLYYLWIPPTGLSDAHTSSPVAVIDSNAVYSVIVSNDCFSDTATTQVFIRPLPSVDAGPDTTIYRDTYVDLNGTTDGIQYFWNPSTWLDDPMNLTTRAEPRETQWYELFAINQWGCSNKDSVLITVDYHTEMDIPTGFSPNGDGVNDEFRIVRWLNVGKLLQFSVFNRWGQQVFSTTNIDQGWDGTVNGRSKADMGVYVWFVRAQTADGKQIVQKGNVTLLR